LVRYAKIAGRSRGKPFIIANTAALVVIASALPSPASPRCPCRAPHGPAVGMIEHFDNKVPGLPVF